MLCSTQIWEIFTEVENYRERESKKIKGRVFLMKYGKKEQGCRQSSWAVNSDTNMCLQVNRSVDSRHLELSTIFYRKLRFVRVWVCYWQSPWAVDNILLLGESEMVYEFVSDPNSEFWFSFLLGLHPLPLNHTLDWINKIALPFCPEDLGRTSLNSYALAFFLMFTCSCDWWQFVVLMFSMLLRF